MAETSAQEHLLIILPLAVPKDRLDRLRQRFPKLKVTAISHGNFSTDPNEMEFPADTFKNVTMLATFSNVPKSVSDAPKLSFIQLFIAGTSHLVDHPVYTDTDIPIATSSGIHGPQIAEMVVLTHLAATHNYKWLHDRQKEHVWGSYQAYGIMRDRVGLRVGILGYGSIGRQIGRMAHAMGMEVVAYTATPKDSAEKRRDQGFIVPGTGDPYGEYPILWYSGFSKKNLHRFLRQNLDWIVVAVPLTIETTNFLGQEEFQVLSENAKNGAPFVTNIARGSIINQLDLIKALKDGTLGGAALDVTEPEPLPPDNELWGMENVIITPHVAGTGMAYIDRAFQILELNLEKKMKGEKLINTVTKEKGY